jgi:hypothetical protein
MQELKVIGVEDGALLVASDEGSRYRVEIDEATHARLRPMSPETGPSRRLAPKEIQAHIRAGMSAEDVASVTGAPLDYVRRFEGPVLAEREFVVESALNVPVLVAVETDPSEGATFGAVIRERLAEARAMDERWASWKEQGGGWIVKLTFRVGPVEHDARWGFDPKKSALSPLNPEAVSLSQQGELPPSLVPRLRAVTTSIHTDTGRFDSGAFEVSDDDELHEPPFAAPVPIGRMAAVDQGHAPAGHQQTADLLEALRRRRGERDPMDPGPSDAMAAHPSTGAIRLIDIPLTGMDDGDTGVQPTAPQPRNSTGPLGRRRGRAAMPTWDEIVFGARPDDDL